MRLHLAFLLGLVVLGLGSETGDKQQRLEYPYQMLASQGNFNDMCKISLSTEIQTNAHSRQ